MKKSFNVLFLACLLICVTSCNSETDNSNNELSTAESEVLSKLDSYTANFLKAHPSNLSKGDLGWGKFKECIKVDYLGYVDRDGIYHGSLSISASRKRWKELKREEIIRELENGGDGNTTKPSTSFEPDKEELRQWANYYESEYRKNPSNFGALHNAAILRIFLEDVSDNFIDIDDTYITNTTLQSLSNLGMDISEINPILALEYLTDFYGNVVDENTAVMFSRLNARHPEKRFQLRFLQNYMNGFGELNSVEDMIEYSDGCYQLLDDSGLDDGIILELKENISIAPASMQLWQLVDKQYK